LAVLDRRTRDQDDYLETLSLLIEAFEDRHHDIDVEDLDPIVILRSLMKSHNMSASDLGRLLGNRSLGAAILRRDRELSKANIMKLCAHIAVGPQLFLKPQRRTRKAG
jgi:antitoxin component HigA of HigAB toxin-antitoxin module